MFRVNFLWLEAKRMKQASVGATRELVFVAGRETRAVAVGATRELIVAKAAVDATRELVVAGGEEAEVWLLQWILVIHILIVQGMWFVFTLILFYK